MDSSSGCSVPDVRALETEGILSTAPLFISDEIRAINAALDPLFLKKAHEHRAYAHPDDLVRLGLWSMIFSERMRSILFSIMPDPVLYHCHAYEIAGGNSASHIFGESLAGWHCDVETPVPAGGMTHISLFVYLSDVAADNGEFEFAPLTSHGWLKARSPCISVFGKTGYTFVWNRRFYHRAAPNRSPVRRRLLKLSIQCNRFISEHIGNPHFESVRSAIPPGDPEMDVLLGRYQGSVAPSTPPRVPPQWVRVPTNAHIEVPLTQLIGPQVRKRFSRLKARVVGVVGKDGKTPPHA